MNVQARYALTFWLKHDHHLFVYFVQEADDGPIKIGHAYDPIERVGMLQCGNPRELRLAGIILGDSEVESQLHRHWHRARIRGEWFARAYSAQVLKAATRIGDAQMEEYKRPWLELTGQVFIKALFAQPDTEEVA